MTPPGRYRKRHRAYPSTGIKEGKQAVKMTRLSCHRFRANEVRFWLSVIAYNLGNLWRRVGAADEDRKLVADEPAATSDEDGWRLFGSMMRRIAALPSPAG